MLPANVPEIERQLWCGGEFERVPCARGRPDGKAMFDIAELVCLGRSTSQVSSREIPFSLSGWPATIGERSIILDVTGRVITR